MNSIENICKYLAARDTTKIMPALFVGHGNPMNAIEHNQYSASWASIGAALGTPAAILCVSAHWLTRGSTQVLTTLTPETIHDFGGFPQALFNQQYPCMGAPDVAGDVIQLCKPFNVLADNQRGIDHGVWSVLLPMFPRANIPVFQLSIDYNQPPAFHYQLAQQLKPLRNKGVLIMGSGNIVHNLHAASFADNVMPYEWAIKFDEKIKSYIDKGDYEAIIDFNGLGALAKQAHPTYDHYLPLLYSLGVTNTDDQIDYFNETIDLASISMRSIIFS